MHPKKETPHTEHLLGVRVSEDLLNMLDEEVEYVRQERGLSVTRSDVVRELLWQTLKQRRKGRDDGHAH
jgi:metal-responsive CopG/Arc/MetJ family transcriptional regulator